MQLNETLQFIEVLSARFRWMSSKSTFSPSGSFGAIMLGTNILGFGLVSSSASFSSVFSSSSSVSSSTSSSSSSFTSSCSSSNSSTNSSVSHMVLFLSVLRREVTVQLVVKILNGLRCSPWMPGGFIGASLLILHLLNGCWVSFLNRCT